MIFLLSIIISIISSIITLGLLVKNKNYYTAIHLGYFLLSWNFGISILVNNHFFIQCSAVTDETLLIAISLIIVITNTTIFVLYFKPIYQVFSRLYLFIYQSFIIYKILNFNLIKYFAFLISSIILIVYPFANIDNLYNLIIGIVHNKYDVVYESRAVYFQSITTGFNKYLNYFYLFWFFNIIPNLATVELFISNQKNKRLFNHLKSLLPYVTLIFLASVLIPFRGYIFKVGLFFVFLFLCISKKIYSHQKLRLNMAKLFGWILAISIFAKVINIIFKSNFFLSDLLLTIVDRMFVIPIFTSQYYINYFGGVKRPFSILNLLLPGKGDNLTGDGPYQVTQYFCGGSFHATTDAYTYAFSTQGILGVIIVAILIATLLLSVDYFYKMLINNHRIYVYLLMFSNIIFTVTSFDSTNLPEQIIIYGLIFSPIFSALVSKQYIDKIKY